MSIIHVTYAHCDWEAKSDEIIQLSLYVHVSMPHLNTVEDCGLGHLCPDKEKLTTVDMKLEMMPFGVNLSPWSF